MKTGSLRTRIVITTLTLLAVVLGIVVTAVTLAYRAKLNSDLRNRLTGAGTLLGRAGSAGNAKELIPGLALEGIATRFGGPPSTAPLKGPRIATRGSLLVLDEILPDGTRVTFSASRASIDHAVINLLLIELAVAGAALALATLLIALETAVEDARASDAATRRFLADASHELRNPIAAVQASVETLLREQPERPERDRLEAAVARDSERLGRLVDDLLGLARLEAHPTRTPVDLASIALPLVDDARTRAPHAAITLSADDDTTVPGDPDALERVLRNLLDNALTAIQPNGRIDVHLRRHNGYVQAHITDDGPGVPEHQRERIFERFIRLDSSKPGLGLGLAIARRIARQHHGNLTCDQAPDGASFTLRIPTEL
jgi:signal transduction histidine kinase